MFNKNYQFRHSTVLAFLLPALAPAIAEFIIPSTLADDTNTSPKVEITPTEMETKWFIAPYLWVPDFRGSTELNSQKVSFDADARDIASGIRAVSMGYLQWRRGSHFLYVDGVWMHFRDDRFEPFFHQTLRARVLFSEFGYGQFLYKDRNAPVYGAANVWRASLR